MYKIFIGHDSRFPEVSSVLAHSLRRRASKPLDIRFLDRRHLIECYNYKPQIDPKASTEFSTSRFLVPWLCNYQGLAAFMDNDCVCLSDPVRLFELMEPGKALMVVQHDYAPSSEVKFGKSGTVQHAYPRKNWSSVMLLSNRLLTAWTKEVVEQGPPARLHRFEDVPDAQIGELPAEWNQLDRRQSAAGILHYTSGAPFLAGCENCPDADLWRQERELWLQSIGETRPLVPVTL